MSDKKLKPKEQTSYLIRDIDRELWTAVRVAAINNNETIRVFILRAIREALMPPGSPGAEIDDTAGDL